MDRLYYLHLHWPLPPELQTAEGPPPGLLGAIAEECQTLCHRHGADLLGLTAGSRRLHLLLRLPTHLSVARWVLLLKGATGRRLGRELNLPLHWERGYGLRSLSPSHVEIARQELQRLTGAGTRQGDGFRSHGDEDRGGPGPTRSPKRGQPRARWRSDAPS
jgi:REP element-mobilizing transposase RayT